MIIIAIKICSQTSTFLKTLLQDHFFACCDWIVKSAHYEDLGTLLRNPIFMIMLNDDIHIFHMTQPVRLMALLFFCLLWHCNQMSVESKILSIMDLAKLCLPTETPASYMSWICSLSLYLQGVTIDKVLLLLALCCTNSGTLPCLLKNIWYNDHFLNFWQVTLLQPHNTVLTIPPNSNKSPSMTTLPFNGTTYSPPR